MTDEPATKHFYMVFGGQRRLLWSGGSTLDWTPQPIGVYHAENPDEACKAAASDIGAFGTFFAIEGFAWGIEMMETKASKLGHKQSAAADLNDRLGNLLERAEQRDAELERLRAELEARTGGEGGAPPESSQ